MTDNNINLDINHPEISELKKHLEEYKKALSAKDIQIANMQNRLHLAEKAVAEQTQFNTNLSLDLENMIQQFHCLSKKYQNSFTSGSISENKWISRQVPGFNLE